MKNYFSLVVVSLALVGCAAYTSFEPPESFGPRDYFMRY